MSQTTEYEFQHEGSTWRLEYWVNIPNFYQYRIYQDDVHRWSGAFEWSEYPKISNFLIHWHSTVMNASLTGLKSLMKN